jgi:multiple sugar transport system ATP-binding protein
MNLVEARVDGDHVVFGQFRVPLDPGRRPPRRRDGRVVLGIRPEAFEDAAFAAPDAPRIEVEVEVVEDLGADAHVYFEVDAPRLTAEVLEAAEDDVALLVQEKALFNARVDPRTSARVHGRLELALDPARLHFFDPETRVSLVTEGAATPALVG